MENKSFAHSKTSPGLFHGDSRLFPYFSMGLVLCIGIALSFSLFMTTRNREDNRIKAGFEQAAKNRFMAFKNISDTYLQEIGALEAFYAASGKVTRTNFRAFTRTLLPHYESTQALEWIPRVSDSERAAYETDVRREGFPAFQITEKNTQGVMVKANRRGEYFPVHFIEPYKGNERALGYDLASEPIKLAALNLSRDTGQVAATAGITLVQEKERNYGVLILRPVYRKGLPAGSIEVRRRNLEGFMVGAFRIGDLLEDAMSSFVPTGMDIYLYDHSAHLGDGFLYFHSSRTRAVQAPPVFDLNELMKGLHYSEILDVAGRKWLALYVPTSDYISSRKTWHAWWLFAAGVLATGLLAGYIKLITAQTAQARQYSARLLSAKEELEHEITERKETEEKLKQVSAYNRSLIEASLDPFVTIAADGKITDVNTATEKVTGYSREELIGTDFSDYFTEQEKARRGYQQVFREGAVHDYALEIRRRDGHVTPVIYNASVYKNEAGAVVGAFATARNITVRKKAEEEIVRAKEEWEKTFDTIPDIVAIIDNQYRIIRANRAMAEKLGVAKEELVGKLCYNLLHNIDEPPSYCPHYKTIAAGKKHLEEFYSENLKAYYIVSSTPLIDSEGRVFGVVEIAHDISHRKRMEERLKATAITDELTGLLNRRGFFTLAEQQCKLSDRTGRRISLLYIDLDGFKTINDELGHDAGDQALIDAANILRKTFREADIIARIGGDEFVVLLTDASQPDIEDIVIRHVSNNLAIHNEQSGRNYVLLFSMGVVTYNPERPCSISELLTRADELMYEDKKRHRLEKALGSLKIEKNQKRAYSRHNADDKCWAELEHAEKAGIKDISAGGICLKLSRQLPVDGIHELRLFPSPDGDITLKGKVVWSSMRDTDADPHRYETGILFFDADTALKRFIDKFMSDGSSGT